MSFVSILKKELASYYLLKHPFYQMWTKGSLPKSHLREYAGQYYRHVCAFPRYISALHSICKKEKDRKILLENLNEEEGFGGLDSHPVLWKNFALGIGVTEEELTNTAVCASIQKLIQTFFSYCRASYAQGLSALYSYEYQVPEVAETKIEGLKKHYGISDKKSLLFFLVHKTADIEHREALEQLLERLSPKEQEKALDSAVMTAKALWGFLTEMTPSDVCVSSERLS